MYVWSSELLMSIRIGDAQLPRVVLVVLQRDTAQLGFLVGVYCVRIETLIRAQASSVDSVRRKRIWASWIGYIAVTIIGPIASRQDSWSFS